MPGNSVPEVSAIDPGCTGMSDTDADPHNESIRHERHCTRTAEAPAGFTARRPEYGAE
ncbi:MAG: hypothetical protein IJK28_07350 [Clostridia bacterium]|nr:hypothetical protein [Clostridia bacterium]